MKLSAYGLPNGVGRESCMSSALCTFHDARDKHHIRHCSSHTLFLPPTFYLHFYQPSLLPLHRMKYLPDELIFLITACTLSPAYLHPTH